MKYLAIQSMLMIAAWTLVPFFGSGIIKLVAFVNHQFVVCYQKKSVETVVIEAMNSYWKEKSRD